MRASFSRPVVLALAVVASTAWAEKAAVNVHLDPAVGTGLDKGIVVTGATLKIDTTLLSFLGPIAPQVEGFGLSAVNHTYLDEGVAFGVGVGARLRLFNDEKGYYFNPGQHRVGNLWGNYWVDAHLTYTTGGFGVGFDVGTGYEFSLVEGLGIGPFAKLLANTQHAQLMFGVSFTIGAPQTTPSEADYDNDGVLGDDDGCIDEAGPKDNKGCPDKDEDSDGVFDRADKCVKEPEDKDGFQDDDGCPEPDNDADGVLDAADACPLVKGTAALKGCPDQDGDGLIDGEDACPAVKGLPENKGCPDTDKDGDGVMDRADKCPDVAGDKANGGCAWPDGDGDTVVDRFDNCPTVAGPPSNSGCPEKDKQLVVITSDKLIIKDKVYFETNKAALLTKSNALLVQVAAVLVAHPDIKRLQIEGHTDNTGDAAFNKTLSGERAESVKAFLVKRGVEEGRLTAVGFGPEKPADTNDTPAGRENNRRVEFNILGQ